MSTNITITTAHPAVTKPGLPVCLVDEELVEPSEGFCECLSALGWVIPVAAERLGRSEIAVKRMRCGTLDVPAECWNVLRDELERIEREKQMIRDKLIELAHDEPEKLHTFCDYIEVELTVSDLNKKNLALSDTSKIMERLEELGTDYEHLEKLLKDSQEA